MFKAEQSSARTLAWILRGVGFVLCLIGLMLLVRPIAVLFSVVPFLEGIVDAAAFIVMFGVAVLVTLATIAITRIVLQPVLSVGLLVLGFAILFGTIRLRGRAKRLPAGTA